MTDVEKKELERHFKHEQQMAKIKDAINLIIQKDCNVMGSKHEEDVAQAIFAGIVSSHRTLQQTWWRVMGLVIKKYAETSSDGRNQGAVDMCKSIAGLLETDGSFLPFV